jgi:hypothetical protein
MSIEKEISELAHKLVGRHGVDACHVAARRISVLEEQGESGAAQLWRQVHAMILADGPDLIRLNPI